MVHATELAPTPSPRLNVKLDLPATTSFLDDGIILCQVPIGNIIPHQVPSPALGCSASLKGKTSKTLSEVVVLPAGGMDDDLVPDLNDMWSIPVQNDSYLPLDAGSSFDELFKDVDIDALGDEDIFRDDLSELDTEEQEEEDSVADSGLVDSTATSVCDESDVAVPDEEAAAEGRRSRRARKRTFEERMTEEEERLCSSRPQRKRAKTDKPRTSPKPVETAEEKELQKLMRQGQMANPDERKKIHCLLERKRRSGMKQSFEELRETIPQLVNRTQVGTCEILKTATSYIAQLEAEERALLKAIEKAKAENVRLRNSVTRMA